MLENRRQFLSQVTRFGGPALLGGAALSLHVGSQAFARQELREEMLSTAAPILRKTAVEERRTLPVSAREDIRRFFHGVCLNADNFVSEVCSQSFGERLRICTSDKEKCCLLTQEFYHQLVTEQEILDRVSQVAEVAGRKLDSNWDVCCGTLQASWSVSVSENEATFNSLDVKSRTESLIRSRMQAVRDVVHEIHNRPTYSQIGKELLMSALAVIPLTRFGLKIAVPAFMVEALFSILPIIAKLLQHRPSDYQFRITQKLSELANRIGYEFQSAITHRLTELHQWRKEAVEQAVDEHVTEALPLLI